MAETTKLIKKREEIKFELAGGEYKTLIEVILDKTGRFIQWITRSSKPVSFWYSAIALTLVTLVVDLFASLVLGEHFFFRPANALLKASGMIAVLAAVIAHKIYCGIFFTTLRDHLLEAIESEKDLTDLKGWLAGINNIKKPLTFGLAFGIVFGAYLTVFVTVSRKDFMGFALTILTMIVSAQVGLVLYYFFSFSLFNLRLSRYEIKLYTVDPSSSEVIDHLSSMFTRGMYITATLASLTTLLFGVLDLLTLPGIIFLIIVGWGPIIFIFLINQYGLSRIIMKAKWKTPNKIQAKIETLLIQEEIPAENSLVHIRALVGYHNEIKATRDSMLDFQAGLNFLNSLLLPLLAFILGNLDKILKIFS